jgi:hypothetical protein
MLLSPDNFRWDERTRRPITVYVVGEDLMAGGPFSQELCGHLFSHVSPEHTRFPGYTLSTGSCYDPVVVNRRRTSDITKDTPASEKILLLTTRVVFVAICIGAFVLILIKNIAPMFR